MQIKIQQQKKKYASHIANGYRNGQKKIEIRIDEHHHKILKEIVEEKFTSYSVLIGDLIKQFIASEGYCLVEKPKLKEKDFKTFYWKET
jgi:hypothetical protein